MSRFKVGQTVYMGRDYKQKEMVVAKVIDNPLLPVYQYKFRPPHDGFAVGEQSLRDTPGGPDLKMSECWKDSEDTGEDDAAIRINTIASGKFHPIGLQDEYMKELFPSSNIFFRPDRAFVKWLVEYANGRLIIDVGSGQGHLVTMLKRAGGRALGIEPNFDKMQWLQMRMQRGGDVDINEILQGTVQKHANLISKLGDKAMLVFARPCHGTFVSEAIDNMPPEMEALYITLPENLEKYNDLGPYEGIKLDHQGSSEDKEVVYSIKKNE